MKLVDVTDQFPRAKTTVLTLSNGRTMKVSEDDTGSGGINVYLEGNDYSLGHFSVWNRDGETLIYIKRNS